MVLIRSERTVFTFCNYCSHFINMLVKSKTKLISAEFNFGNISIIFFQYWIYWSLLTQIMCVSHNFIWSYLPVFSLSNLLTCKSFNLWRDLKIDLNTSLAHFLFFLLRSSVESLYLADIMIRLSIANCPFNLKLDKQ